MVRALPILKDAWHLAKPYFVSEEKWSAWLLLAAIIVLNLALVAMNVVFNFWNGQWFDSIQNKNWDAFMSLLLTWHVSKSGFMPGFLMLATVYVGVSVYAIYLNQWLQIRWRRWLTRHFLDEWLAERAYYRLSLTASPHGTGTDNPDQRISEDLRDFTTNTLSLGIDMMSNVVTLGSFAGVLWSLSGTLHLWGMSIPGYMFWVALIYSALGTWVTHLVGSPLAVLRFLQQRYEADFRFSLVRFRENVEGVALYGGEREERGWMARTFQSVIVNWWQLMRRIKLLNALTSTYSTLVMVFPYLVAAPRFFAGQIQLGGLMRTGQAFGQVQGSMSWFVNNYSALATWSATIERLATFHRAVVAARAGTATGVIAENTAAVPALTLNDVSLALPGGEPLLSDQSFAFAPGERTLITGRSGSGKSTLFRAIAGIWPFGSGKIERPMGTYLFLPQRPYIPLGTLRHAVCYPAADEAYDDASVQQALADVGLGHLVDRLNQEANWALTLSGGEQQRLAVARALLAKPDWLFLDEATANLDREGETQLYRVLTQRLPHTSVISIAHQDAVARFHDRHLSIERAPGECGRVLEAEPVEPARVVP